MKKGEGVAYIEKKYYLCGLDEEHFENNTVYCHCGSDAHMGRGGYSRERGIGCVQPTDTDRHAFYPGCAADAEHRTAVPTQQHRRTATRGEKRYPPVFARRTVSTLSVLYL